MKDGELKICIKDREEFIFMLAEAAAIEHKVMCCYFYGIWSLKRGVQDGLTPEQAEIVQAWKRAMTEVAVEEMSHLTLVCNLSCSIGAGPHLSRPDFPIPFGYHPSAIDLELRGFCLVKDLETARQAVETIIEQGECAPLHSENSHCRRFLDMRDNMNKTLAEDPDFDPAFPVAQNLVPNEPMDPENRVWITDPEVARIFPDGHERDGISAAIRAMGSKIEVPGAPLKSRNTTWKMTNLSRMQKAPVKMSSDAERARI